MKMRVKLELAPATDMVWEFRDHYKFRGLVYDAIDNSALEWIHNDYDTPKFTFSNVFSLQNPHRGNGTQSILNEQEDCLCFFTTPHDSLAYKLEHELKEQNAIEIGENKFYVDGVYSFDYSVSVSESGSLTASNGVVSRLNKEQRDKHGIEDDSEQYGIDDEDFKSSWLPDHGMDVFEDMILDNLYWKLDKLHPDVEKPESFYDIFDYVQYKTTFQTKMPVKSDLELTFFPSTFEFGYSVQTEEQRIWINTLLNAGIGEKNPLGYGILNKN